MFKHTSGPWIVDDKTDKRLGLTIRAPGVATASAPCPAVAKINTPRSWSEARHNARLIAAAPDMLALLKKARDRIGVLYTHSGLVVSSPDDVYEEIEAEIRKIEGE